MWGGVHQTLLRGSSIDDGDGGGVHQTLLRGSSIDDGDGPTSRVTCCVVMKSGAAFNRTVGCVRMSGFLTFTFQLWLPFSPCLHVLWYRSLDLNVLESSGQSVDHLLLKLDLMFMRDGGWRWKWIPMTRSMPHIV